MKSIVFLTVGLRAASAEQPVQSSQCRAANAEQSSQCRAISAEQSSQSSSEQPVRMLEIVKAIHIVVHCLEKVLEQLEKAA